MILKIDFVPISFPLIFTSWACLISWSLCPRSRSKLAWSLANCSFSSMIASFKAVCFSNNFIIDSLFLRSFSKGELNIMKKTNYLKSFTLDSSSFNVIIVWKSWLGLVINFAVEFFWGVAKLSADLDRLP